jgi:hypothetical protein
MSLTELNQRCLNDARWLQFYVLQIITGIMNDILFDNIHKYAYLVCGDTVKGVRPRRRKNFPLVRV